MHAMRLLLQRTGPILVLSISVAGFLFSAWYLEVHFPEVPRQLKQNQTIQKGGNSSSDTTGVAAQAAEGGRGEKAPGWSRFDAFLRRQVYDLSFVTPLLMVWFFGGSIWGSLVCLRRLHAVRYRSSADYLAVYDDLPANFPYYPSDYEETWIQLGFIGTLWGFLIIGWKMRYSSMDKMNIDALDILVKAFGTALLSTFTAVVLVFVLAPVFKFLLRGMHGGKIGPDNGFALQVKHLVSAIGNLRDGLSRNRAEIESLAAETVNLRGRLETIVPSIIVPKLDAMVETMQEQAGTSAKVLAAFKEREGELLSAIKTTKETQMTLAENMNTGLAAIASILAAMDKNEEGRLQAIESSTRGVAKEMSALRTAKQEDERKSLSAVIETTKELAKTMDTHFTSIKEALRAVSITVERLEAEKNAYSRRTGTMDPRGSVVSPGRGWRSRLRQAISRLTRGKRKSDQRTP